MIQRPFCDRIILMGSPGTGKSTQLLNCVRYLQSLGVTCHILDFEDKLAAMTYGADEKWPLIKVATAWEEMKEQLAALKTSPGDWIMVDRVDLTWPAVQRWYTQQRYNQDLASLMVEKAKQMKAKASQFVPRFDEGSWQVINENYDSWILELLYGRRCHLLMTTGIKEDTSGLDVFGHLGVLPRGQKELGHQPNSVFLLYQKKVGREILWCIKTGKDLESRGWFDDEQLYDFAIQYLGSRAGWA